MKTTTTLFAITLGPLLFALSASAQTGSIFVDENHNGHKIYGLPTPTTSNEAATKGYADSIAGGGGGAPTNAHYVTTQAEAGLSAEFSLGSLASGILKQTVSGSVSTPAIAASSDIIGLFTSCSGTQYLGADGACHTASGSGTVTNFSAGDLSPLFTTTEATTTTTPALSFILSTAAANSWFGNATGSTAAPAFNTLVFPAALMPAYTGDVTSSSGSTVNTITNSAVTYAKIQNVSANSKLLGSSATGSGAPPSEITLGTNLSMSGTTLNATGGGSGTVTTTGSPATGNLTKFSGATSITTGDLSGDVTTSGTLATTIASGAVTYGKMQNVSASSKLLGSSASGSGAPPSEITLGTNLSMTGSTLNAAAGSVTAPLMLTLTDAGTNTIPEILAIDHESSATPLTGFGSAFNFYAKSDTTASRQMAAINSNWSVVTDGSRSAVLDFRVFNTTSHLTARMWPSGSLVVGGGTTDAASSSMVVASGGFATSSSAVTVGKFLQSNATSFVNSTYALPTAPSTSGRIFVSDGTNIQTSTPTFPANASAVNGSTIKSDGTNWISHVVPYGVVTATVDQTAVTETAHVVYTVPANSAAVGTTYRIAAWGDMDNGTTAITFTPRVRWGGTGGVQLIATPTVVGTTTALTNKTWRAVVNVTIRTTGASGTAFCEVQLSNHTVSSAGAYGGDEASSGGTGVTVNTTTSNDLDLTWTLSATTGTPHVRTYGGYVEIIN